MIDRAERLGLGASAVAHVALFGALSLGLLVAPKSMPPLQAPVDVSLVDEVGLEAAMPEPAREEPAPSVAPEVGLPEPAPPEPQPSEPAPPAVPTPAPKAVAKPVAATRPAPKPQAAPPAPAARPKSITTASAPPRGSRLGPEFLKGISDRPSAGTAQTARTAKIGTREMAGLVDAIRRQVQPCADRINNPGPGANAISTKLNLRLNRDGSFAASPTVISQTGVDAENERYAKRVGELAASAFVQCAPFALPDELFDGWKNFNLNYKLPA
ncbi:MAG: hypothetical protein ACKVOP_07290 [Sphingomonadaceae bacterium]